MDPVERARHARARAEVLADLAFETAVHSILLHARLEAVRLTPTVEALLLLRLGRTATTEDALSRPS